MDGQSKRRVAVIGNTGDTQKITETLNKLDGFSVRNMSREEFDKESNVFMNCVPRCSGRGASMIQSWWDLPARIRFTMRAMRKSKHRSKMKNIVYMNKQSV